MADYFIEEDVKKRLEELAMRSLERQTTVFTRFLTPPQQQYALALGKRLGIKAKAFGGFTQGERQVVAFSDVEVADSQFPISAIEIVPKDKRRPFTAGHRDILGAFLATGLDRSYVGDIILEGEKALVFVVSASLPVLLDQINEVGRLQVSSREVAFTSGEIALPQGERVKSTVASLRLDGMLAKALNQNREKTALLIEKGLVKVNHLPVVKKDKNLSQGDIISLRGYGRIEVEEIGSPNRKKRIPISLLYYGLKN